MHTYIVYNIHAHMLADGQLRVAFHVRDVSDKISGTKRDVTD